MFFSNCSDTRLNKFFSIFRVKSDRTNVGIDRLRDLMPDILGELNITLKTFNFLVGKRPLQRSPCF